MNKLYGILILLAGAIFSYLVISGINQRFSEVSSVDCTQGVIKEKIITRIPTDSLNTKEQKLYLLECNKGGQIRIKANRNYPLETTLHLQWVKKQ